jgi:hypothetical protein
VRQHELGQAGRAEQVDLELVAGLVEGNVLGGAVESEPGVVDDLERVVRESFRFLLEREPATSILRQFSLSDISRYFPEYPSELARRLS